MSMSMMEESLYCRQASSVTMSVSIYGEFILWNIFFNIYIIVEKKKHKYHTCCNIRMKEYKNLPIFLASLQRDTTFVTS